MNYLLKKCFPGIYCVLSTCSWKTQLDHRTAKQSSNQRVTQSNYQSNRPAVKHSSIQSTNKPSNQKQQTKYNTTKQPKHSNHTTQHNTPNTNNQTKHTNGGLLSVRGPQSSSRGDDAWRIMHAVWLSESVRCKQFVPLGFAFTSRAFAVLCYEQKERRF